MKATYFLFSTIIATASAAPRISQISPATGAIDGEPVAWDIDQDGDLDLAYLYQTPQPQRFGSQPQTSTWLENLGGQKFSAPRSLGHTFQSSRRTTLNNTLITPANSQVTFLVTSVFVSATEETELHFKSTSSTSWQLLRRFDRGSTVSFLKSPAENSPAIFVQSEQHPNLLTMWSLNNVGGLIRVSEIPLPNPEGSGIEAVSQVQVADLDQDGDADLVFEYLDETYIFERLESGDYSPDPVQLDLEDAIIGDLNLDGLPDLIAGNSLRGIAVNRGDLIFDVLADRGPNRSGRAAFVATVQDKPTLLTFLNQANSIQVTTYELNEAMTFSIADEVFSIPLSDRPFVADFDDDGQGEVALISRSNPFRSFIQTRRSGFPVRRIIPSTNARPNFDQVIIAWDDLDSSSDFSRASCEAPVICDQPAVGDFNNDGSIDLIVGPDSEGNAWIMLNDGRGGFSESRVLSELVPPGIDRDTFHLQDFVSVDLNEDGFLDLSFSIVEAESLLVGSQIRAACAVARGNGTGNFAPVTFPPGTFETVSVGFCGITEFIDWDGDGDQDAILQGGWRENVDGVLRDGIFPLVRNAPTTDALGNPVIVSAQQVSDIDGDGFPDLFLPAITSTPADLPNPPAVGINPIYYNDYTAGVAFNSGDGNLAEVSDRPARVVVTDALGNPAVLPFLALDLDVDGRRELLTADPAADALGNPVFPRLFRWKLDAENPRDLSQAQSLAIPAFSVPFSDELVDFNGDGELEYAAADQFVTPTLRGPLISPKYLFKGDHLSQSFPSLSVVAAADFDNDGDLDSLYANGFSGLHLVRNTLVDEDSAITAALTAQGLTPARATPQVDADGDGRSNALEFLHGTDPLVSDEAPKDFLKTALSADGQRILFSQPTNAADFDLYFDLQSSDDLVNWRREEALEKVSVSIEGNFEKVSMEFPRSLSKKYFRIFATHDPRR